MTEPMTDARLADIRAQVSDGTGVDDIREQWAWGIAAELLAEVERMRDELAEVRASHNPLLRCLLIKAAPDRDLYVGWSNVVKAPTGIWTRTEALNYGFPRSRLDRADKNGSSATGFNDGHWDDEGFIAEQRGWLRRDRIGDYAQAYARDDMNAAWDLLEPFEGETEVHRD